MSHVRKAWIDASHFHPLEDQALLQKVLEEVRAHGSSPLVVFDLDSTLYEVAPRTLQILQEWKKTGQAEQFARVYKHLSNLVHEHVGYSLKDTFVALGLSLEDPEVHAAMKSVKPFWLKRFFSSEYLVHDRPYAGTAEYVQKVFDAGGNIVYLTGRDEPGMGKGTREILKRDGFPVHLQRTSFYLKPQREGDDELHKANASREIKKQGKVIASFENEPRNLVAMSQILPDAMHVFVDTVCSDSPAEAGRGLYRLKGFHSAK